MFSFQEVTKLRYAYLNSQLDGLDLCVHVDIIYHTVDNINKLRNGFPNTNLVFQEFMRIPPHFRQQNLMILTL